MTKSEEKQKVIEKLKENGCRITKQRELLIDIILEKQCESCKEIYAEASKIDKTIGCATVYRMINLLEDIGAISRKNMYKIDTDICKVTMKDGTNISFTSQMLIKWIRKGIEQRGYNRNAIIEKVVVNGKEYNIQEGF